MAAPTLALSATPNTGVVDAFSPADLAWERPGGGRILMKRDLVLSLVEQAKHGFDAAPRGGIEVGGLLVGSSQSQGDQEVQELLPVMIEYRYGPMFRLSESDLAILAEAGRSVRKDPSKAVVGIYRSRVRGEIAVRDSDRETLRAVPGDQPLGLLVLNPIGALKTSATMLWPDQDVRPNVRPIPPQPKLEVAPKEGAASAVPAAIPSLDPVRRVRGGRKVALLLCLGAVGVVMTGGFLGYETGLRQPAIAKTAAVPAFDLGFSARRVDQDWKLTWNRAALTRLAPEGATLIIRDGSREQQLALSADELAYGSVVYAPRGGDLLFRLRVNHVGRTPLEERVRVLAGQAAAESAAVPVEEARGTKTEAPRPALSQTTFEALGGSSVRPIREVSAVSPGRPVGSGLDVRVQVQIDANGKVTDAKPLGRTKSNAAWVDRATSAARRWVFQAARQDGQTVPAEAILTFHFRQI